MQEKWAFKAHFFVATPFRPYITQKTVKFSTFSTIWPKIAENLKTCAGLCDFPKITHSDREDYLLCLLLTDLVPTSTCSSAFSPSTKCVVRSTSGPQIRLKRICAGEKAADPFPRSKIDQEIRFSGSLWRKSNAFHQKQRSWVTFEIYPKISKMLRNVVFATMPPKNVSKQHMQKFSQSENFRHICPNPAKRPFLAHFRQIMHRDLAWPQTRA